MKNPFIANKLNFFLATITPELARFLLEKYYGNIRSESRGHISRLKRTMLSKRFNANNDCLAFQIFTGIILNGHHRLTAIAESGVTVQIGVCVGLHEDALLSMDTGNIRDNGTCIASSMGQGKETNSVWKKRTSIANMCLRSQNGFKLKDLPDNAEKKSYYFEHQSGIDAAMIAGVNRKTNGSGFRAAMSLYFHENNKQAQTFFALVTSNGDEIKPRTPAHALYRYFESVQRGNGGESNRMKKDFYATLRAVQANRKDESLTLEDLNMFF